MSFCWSFGVTAFPWLLSAFLLTVGALRIALQGEVDVSQPESFTPIAQNATESAKPPRLELKQLSLLFSDSSEEYIWNKENDTPEQYQWNWCNRWCNGSEAVKKEGGFKCKTVKCIDCFCERPACEIYDLCCPGYVTVSRLGLFEATLAANNNDISSAKESEVPSDQNSDTGDDSSTTNQNLKEESIDKVKCGFSFDGWYLYIQSCPRHFNDSRVRRLCEEEVDPEMEVSEDIISRVSDTVNRVVYYNKYCALCNEAEEAVPWRVEIACKHFMSVYKALTMGQLLSGILKDGSDCRLDQFVMPESFQFVRCPRISITNEAPIETCNVTGTWETYDADVERACNELRGRRFNVYHSPSQARSSRERGLYSNIFCAKCNMAGYPVHGLCNTNAGGGGGQQIPKRRTPPFSVLLGYRRRKRLPIRPAYVSSFTFNKCGEKEWSSPDGRCLPLHCSPGKEPKNGTCTTALDLIRGLGYQLNLWLHINKSHVESIGDNDDQYSVEDVHNHFIDQMMELLSPLIDSYDLNIGAILSFTPHISNALNTSNPVRAEQYSSRQRLDSLAAFWISGHVGANVTVPRDTFEAQIMDNLVNGNITLNYFDYECNLLSQLSLGEVDMVDFCLQPNVECIVKKVKKLREESTFFEQTGSFLTISEGLNCQNVRFNNTAYKVKKSKGKDGLVHTKVFLTLGKTTLTFLESRDLNQMFIDERYNLNTCEDSLNTALKSLDEKMRKDFYSNDFRAEVDDITQVQYYATLVCVGASMVCLFLALVTYFRFRVLRSVAGMNNMFLCGSLLLAQASLLTSVHVSGPQTLCTALGVMTHFLWLWMFTWSFICCFRMFRVFTAKTRQGKSFRSQRARFVWMVVRSVLPAVLIVSTVVVASLLTSGGDRLGYGDQSCYLDSGLLIGISTALPLALVTVANIVFFSLTVAKINNVKKLQSSDFNRKEDRRNLYIYVKLSTMTGIFWLIQLLAEATNLDVLRLIAILLNGLQGVLIFVSYICNTRVLNLYLTSLGLNPVDSTSSQSQRGTRKSTLGALASKVHKADTSTTDEKAIERSEAMASSGRECESVAVQKETKGTDLGDDGGDVRQRGLSNDRDVSRKSSSEGSAMTVM